MKNILSVENMRKSDAATIAAKTPGRTLMMRAARGVFESVSWKGRVGIVCGSGNNAGDGYALALCLDEAGIDCTVICIYDRFSDDGRYYYEKCKEAGIRISGPDEKVSYATFDMIVDCLLGTGFKGEVREYLAGVMEKINTSGAYVVSVDINSGLNGDTGMASLCVRSDLTVSIGDFKPGHFLNMAKDVMKDKVNCDIGIEPVDQPYHLVEASDVSAALPMRDNMSNKGTYGYAALIGGCVRYSGAIRLAYLANAAMRSGAGVVKVALPAAIAKDVTPHILESTLFPLSDTCAGNPKQAAEEVHDQMESASPFEANAQVMYVPGEIDELISNVRTVAFGMGIGTGEGARQILEHLLTGFDGNLIVDADGLTLLSGSDRQMTRDSKCIVILTPHIKEFSRLTGRDIKEINEDPVGIAAAYAADTGTIVLLKGPSTIITDGSRVFITDRGCAGMATAGSGDVLSGILAATVSYIDDKVMATAAAAYINGAAGQLASSRYGDISMIASDTVASIPEVIMSLAQKPRQ